MPLVFGLGAPLVAMVGTNIGAGQRARALRIAMAGGAVAFAVTEAIGVAAAVWPQAGSVCSAPTRTCWRPARYLRMRGTDLRLLRPRLSRFILLRKARGDCSGRYRRLLRMLVAIGGGWLALRATGSLLWLFAALALGLFLHGMTLLIAIGSGAWFGRPAPGRSAGVP